MELDDVHVRTFESTRPMLEGRPATVPGVGHVLRFALVERSAHETRGDGSPCRAAPPGRARRPRRCARTCAPRQAARSCCSRRRSPRSSGRTSPRRPTVVLDDRALDHARPLVDLRGSAPLGQRGPDGVLLLRGRPRGAARVRHGRAARAPAHRAAGARGHRRDDGAGADLPRVQPRRPRRARLGRRDVDRHGVRARHARARRPALPRAAARLHADGRRRRRRGRAARDRDRVHRPRRGCRRSRSRSAIFALRARRPRARRLAAGSPYLALGVAGWVALYESGIQPEIIGLAMGLVTGAYAATRVDLERATRARPRSFREQPTPELAREARLGVASAISPNERAQTLLHPWTSYGVVPIFALANAGVVDRRRPARPGDPLADHDRHLRRLRRRQAGRHRRRPRGSRRAPPAARLRPPVGWPALAGGGRARGHRLHRVAADLEPRVHGRELAEAKLGVLAAAVGASLARLAPVPRARAATRARCAPASSRGRPRSIIDLAMPVDPEIDHVRGPDSAPVTLVEYGDFECPYCGRAEPALRDLLAEFGDDLRYVYRHLPLPDVHPRAKLAAEASEAAGEAGRFWEMHDLLFDHQDALRPPDLLGYASGARPRRRPLRARAAPARVRGAHRAGHRRAPT